MTGPRLPARTRVTSRLTQVVGVVGRCVGVVGRLVGGLVAAVVLVALLGGVPWAAVRWVGWPLPHHVPTWDEVAAVLSQPASTGLVVDILTCLGWLLWAAFAVDVARSGIAAARAARWPQAPAVDLPGGPVQALAAALVGAIVLTLLGSRTLATPTRTDAPADRPAAVTAGFAGPPSTGHTLTLTRTGGPGGWAAPAPYPGTEAQLSGRSAVVVVRAAAGGIHDSLWRVAQRALGDGARWPEIYQLNKGRLQPDGRRLASPNLIYPGWRLTLPSPPHNAPPVPPRPGGGGDHGGTSTPAPRPPAPPAPTPASPSTPVPRSPSAPATPAPTSPPLPSAPPTPTGGVGSQAPSRPAGTPDRTPAARPSPGVELPGGGYVGLELAGLITAAALALRQWRRTHPTADPAWREEDTDMAPVVRALRLAHAEAHHPHHDSASGGNPAALPDSTTRALPVAAPVVVGAGQPAVEGVRDGLTQALELAGSRGLGLIGDGAPDAARALLVSLLAGRHHAGAGPVEVLVPADALTAVLPTAERAGRPWPTRLRVTRDLDTALDTAEVELVTRARLSAERRAGLGTLVILAIPQPQAERRLQAVLDNGSTLGIAGVLLGQWRPGGTVRVRADGTVAAASPDIADTLDQTRLFTLPTRHTTDLLDLLAAADPAAADRDDTHTDPTDTDQPDTGQTESAGQSPSPDDTGSRPARQPDTGAGTATAALVDRVATGPAPRRTEASAGLHADRLGPAAASGPVGMDLELGRPPGRAEDDRAGPPAPRHTLGGGRHPTDGGPASAGPPAAADSDDAGGRQAAVRRPATAPLWATVLGRLHLYHRPPGGAGAGADVVGALAPRQREILVYLALHPDGARRELLAVAIWPDAPTERPYNSFHATLSQLRKALGTATGGAARDLVFHADGHYRLNPDLVDVDLWHLHDALATARGGDPDPVAALRRVPDLYSADLAEDLTADWLTGPRETLRRQVLDALSTLVHTTSHAEDPRQVLAWLEHARTLDPHNEAIYRDIIRTQARLGQHDAIGRTLTLLATNLADIDRQPAPDTLALTDQLSADRVAHSAQ